MAARSPTVRFDPGYKRKSVKILDYEKQERMNAINNNTPKVSAKKRAEAFGVWLKKLMDEDRNDIGLYLAEDCVLQWFGRTIKSKKDISGFLKYDMSYTVHRLESITPCETISLRRDGISSIRSRSINSIGNSLEELATPIADVTPLQVIKSLQKTPTKSPTSKRTRSVSSSPEGAKLKKKYKNDDKNGTNIESPDKFSLGNIHMRYELRSKHNKKLIIDSIESKKSETRDPTTSDDRLRLNNPDKGLNLSYLPRCYMEAKCVLKFATSKSRKGVSLEECERKCKMQIAYSENPVCRGEYIIWTIVYSDNNNKCRRNLLSAFEAVSKESEK